MTFSSRRSGFRAAMAEGVSVYIFHATRQKGVFRGAFKEAGFHICGVCIWVKNTAGAGAKQTKWHHEPLIWGWLPNGNHRWLATASRPPSRVRPHPECARASCTRPCKPVPLLAYLIKNSSAPNGHGAGYGFWRFGQSTFMACEQTDRICYTMELDPRYASVIVERFTEACRNAPIQRASGWAGASV